MTRSRQCVAAVPAYFHPAVAPADWDRLLDVCDSLRFVVLNVGDGPGHQIDPTYEIWVKRLQARGATVIGYIDTDYSRRPITDALADLDSYRRWYGIDGVFLDRVDARPEAVDYYTVLTEETRSHGAGLVVLNPGVPADTGLQAVADVIVTFEGPWKAYLHAPPARRPRLSTIGRFGARRRGAEECHLVYDVPVVDFPAAADLVLRRGASITYVTDGVGVNPWSSLSRFVATPGDFITTR